MTFEVSIGVSRLSRPPCGLFGWPRFTCLKTRLTPSTSNCLPPLTTCVTRCGVRLAWSPPITTTMSPRLIFMGVLNDLAGQAQDFGEFAVSKLAGHRAKDTGPARVPLVVDQDDRIAIEPDVAAVLPSRRGPHADDHAFGHCAFLDGRARNGLLNRDDDDVAQTGCPPLGTAQHLDAPGGFGAGVIGDIDDGLHLDHGMGTSSTEGACDPVLTILSSRQRFVFERGRVSTISTVSPSLAVFSSSWTWQIVRLRTILPYFGCR